jgi:MFS family permease
MKRPRAGIFAASWLIYWSVLCVMTGNGLQSSALSLRLSILDGRSAVVGIVMSAAYVGLLVGSPISRILIAYRGARFSLLLALAILTLGFVLLPLVESWPIQALLRLAIGVSLAAFYVVVESRLNATATSTNRARTMSIYIAAVYAGLVLGQPLLSVTDPLDVSAFWVAAAVVLAGACGAIDVSTDKTCQGAIGRHAVHGSARRIITWPVIGCCALGLSQGAFFGAAPSFGHGMAFDKKAVALFMTLGTLGGGLMQIPAGWAADRWGRRRVATIAASCAIPTLLLSIAGMGAGDAPLYLALLIGLWGGATIPIYPMLLAEANEGLDYASMVSVSGRLIIAFGAGAILGPLGATSLMGLMGSVGFYVFLIAANSALLTGGLVRLSRTGTPVAVVTETEQR